MGGEGRMGRAGIEMVLLWGVSVWRGGMSRSPAGGEGLPGRFRGGGLYLSPEMRSRPVRGWEG